MKIILWQNSKGNTSYVIDSIKLKYLELNKVVTCHKLNRIYRVMKAGSFSKNGAFELNSLEKQIDKNNKRRWDALHRICKWIVFCVQFTASPL